MLPSKWLFLPVWVVYLLALVAFEVIADVLAKQFALNGKLVFGALSLGCYVLANSAWLISLRSGGTLSRGSVIFSAQFSFSERTRPAACSRARAWCPIGACLRFRARVSGCGRSSGSRCGQHW